MYRRYMALRSKDHPSKPSLGSLPSPMLLTPGRFPLPSPGPWIFEIKIDGYRLIVGRTDDQVRLQTRGGADATRWFPEVVHSIAQLPPGHFIFDGEVAVLDDIGRSDFDLLHARARARGWKEGLSPVVYCVFDVLVYYGRDVRLLPLAERKALLAALFVRPIPGIMHVTSVDDGPWLFQQALALSLEGVVAKRYSSPYVCGERSDDWVKIKRKGATPPGRFSRRSTPP